MTLFAILSRIPGTPQHAVVRDAHAYLRSVDDFFAISSSAWQPLFADPPRDTAALLRCTYEALALIRGAKAIQAGASVEQAVSVYLEHSTEGAA